MKEADSTLDEEYFSSHQLQLTRRLDLRKKKGTRPAASVGWVGFRGLGWEPTAGPCSTSIMHKKLTHLQKNFLFSPSWARAATVIIDNILPFARIRTRYDRDNGLGLAHIEDFVRDTRLDIDKIARAIFNGLF